MDANLISILKQEHAGLSSQILSVESQIQDIRNTLEEKVTSLQEQRDQLVAKMRHIQALLTLEGIHVQESSELLKPSESKMDGLNAPSSLADAVNQLLKDKEKEMHYRDIFKALEARGIHVPGKDPGINLVAHIHSDPRFLRPRRGVYGLKGWYPKELRSVGARKTHRRKKRVSVRKKTSIRSHS